jgi:hypothetical protein
LKNARYLDLSLAIETVNSSTSYVYDPRTRTYLQPVSASSTLQKFSAVNSLLLQKLTIPENFPIEGRDTIQKGAPLTDLIAVGVKDQSSAPAILSTLMEILGKQTEYVARYVDPWTLYESSRQIPGPSRDRRLPGTLLQNIIQGPPIFNHQILSPLNAPITPRIRQWEEIFRTFYLHCSIHPSLTRLHRREAPFSERCLPQIPCSAPR